MQKLVKASFYISISLCIVTILVIIATYFYVKPSLPKINLVDESELQMPMKIFTKDGKLIGEFGEIKRNDAPQQGLLGKIQQTLLSIGLENRSIILSKFPKLLRRVGGYNIDALIPDAMAFRPNGKPGDGINLAHLLVGSEGTLAIFKNIA